MLKIALKVLLISILILFVQGGVLRSTLPSIIPVPNLALILVVYLAFYETTPLGSLLAFIMGLLLDFLSGTIIGPWAAAFVAVFGFLSSLSQHIFIESPLTSNVIVFISTIAANLINFFLVYEFKNEASSLAWVVLFESIITALISPYMIKALKGMLVRRDPFYGA